MAEASQQGPGGGAPDGAIDTLVQGVLAGDVAATARACRWVDDRHASATALLSRLYPATGKAWRLGITGPAGVGKSTLVDALIAELRSHGQCVGVVLVDPTSPFSGGALLGDRIRMQRHAEDPEVFIRSLASRGGHGGLSSTTLDVVRVLEAWGAQTVIIETVGVGQTEVEILRAADTTLVVLQPGGGDHVQTAKAGLLEIADVFAVNKDDLPGADASVQNLESMIALGLQTRAQTLQVRGGHGVHSQVPAHSPGNDDGWIPTVQRLIANSGKGVPELLAELQRHHDWLHGSAAGRERSLQRRRWELLQRFQDRVTQVLLGEFAEALAASVQRVASGQDDPYAASERLLQQLRERS